MKRLAAAFLLLLLPAQALAAWTDSGTMIIDANDGTSVTAAPLNTNAALNVGDVCICAVASDETDTGTTDGDLSEHTAPTDASSNTWVKAKQFENAQTAAAADGANVSLWYTVITSTLAASGALTFNFSAATTAKAFACRKFTKGAGTTVSVGAGSSTRADDAADPGSMTVATGVSKEHLFVRATACETNSTTWTPTATYTAFTDFAGQFNSGTALTSMAVGVEFLIQTASNSTASDPTMAAADCASVMVALDEVAAGGGGNGSWGAWRRR